MRRFYISHLLVFMTMLGTALAIAIRLDRESLRIVYAMCAAFAPCVCYSIASFASRRTVRRIVRCTLLSIVFAIAATVFVSTYGGDFLFPAILLTVMLWVPQLFLLGVCSAYRSAIY